MNHERFVAILLWIAFLFACGWIITDCSRCELNGGVYIRGTTKSHCIDPSTGKAKP